MSFIKLINQPIEDKDEKRLFKAKHNDTLPNNKLID